MSNNNNNRNQPAAVVSGPITSPVAPKELGRDPVKEAVVLCLNILLRAATMGTVARANEGDIKLALAGLE